MAGIKLFLLGPPRIEVDGQVAEPDTRKAVALLAYLALSGERLSRDALAVFLWPEFDDRRARAALRRTLSALKATIGKKPLYASREQIGVEMEHLWCDVLDFRRSITAANTYSHPADSSCSQCKAELEIAVSLYRDEFMSGFSLRDSVLFDDWQIQQAEDLRRDLDGALEQLVRIAGGRHEFEDGIDYARRWLQIDPLREEAHRQLMCLYSWSGNRSAALMQYRECVRILDEELGVSPLPQTTTLYQKLQDEALPPPILEYVPVARAEASTEAPEQTTDKTAVAPSDIPLVGRDAELTRLRSLYESVDSNGRLLIIEGEPGIGKSRLAEALLSWASAGGAATLNAHCYEGESTLAYAPIIKILQDGLDQVDSARLEALPKRHLAEAARLLPDLTERFSLPTLPTLNNPGEQVRFYDGITELLTVLLEGEAPGILWLDDAHWLDSASQEYIIYLLHRWQNRPFLCLLCWQVEELFPNNPMLPLAAELRRAGVSETVRLQRFDVKQINELLTAAGHDFPPRLSERLFKETEGLPYFAVEYLSAMEDQNKDFVSETSLPTPASVRDLLHSRLMRVTETERQVLQGAAVIGHGFN
ncbi:MAG: ATP-binding protein, partial [Candidatus Promineifilaceae bacterium]